MQRSASGAFAGRSPYAGSNAANRSGRYRRPYVSPYRTRYAYGAAGYGVPWIGPGYMDYADSDDGQSADQGPVAQNGYGDNGDPDQSPYPQPALPLAPYPPQPAEAHSNGSQPSQAAVTLIYKDGRPPEQIHNYILTGTTLYVGNRWPAEIPVDELDLAETVKVNRDAGVDFQMPAGTR
jgi:hypothetical protein